MGERVLTRMTLAASKPAGEPSRPCTRIHVLSRLRLEERGTAVVEFALVALPLFLIVFGILDFGRALNYYNDLTQLTGQGARAASVNQNPNGGPANAAFQQQLVDAADSNELKSGISVCVTDMPASAGDRVTVTASYNFTFIPLVRSATLTLHASQSARFEASSPTFSAGCKP